MDNNNNTFVLRVLHEYCILLVILIIKIYVIRYETLFLVIFIRNNESIKVNSMQFAKNMTI